MSNPSSAAPSGGEGIKQFLGELPHEADHGRTGHPAGWCRRCALESELSALLTEVERLTLANRVLAHQLERRADGMDDLMQMLRKQVQDAAELHLADETTINQLERMLAAERERHQRDTEDAERYRWVRPRLLMREREPMNGGPARQTIEIAPGCSFFDSKSVRRNNPSGANPKVDAAIDAARSASPEGEQP